MVLLAGCYPVGYREQYQDILNELNKVPVRVLNQHLDTNYFGKIDLSGELALDRVVDFAHRNNPQILSALKDWQAELERYPQVTALDDPVLKIGPPPARSSFSLSQRLPYPEKLTLRGGMVLARAKALEQLYREKINEIIKEVKDAYYKLSYVHEAIRINKEQMLLVDKLQRTARQKYENAIATQYDVVRAQIKYTHLLHRAITLERDLQLAKARLNRLLNRRPQAPLGNPVKLELRPYNLSLDELLELATQTRPCLRAASHRIAETLLRLKLARLEYIPEITLGINYTERDDGDGVGATLGVNIPIQISSRKAKIREAEQLLARAKSDYLKIRNQVLEEVKTAFEELLEAQRSATLYRDTILLQAQQTYELANKGYENDRVDLLSVIDAQTSLEDVQLEYYRSVIDSHKALARLRQAVGGEIK